jgi:hypothetical protein
LDTFTAASKSLQGSFFHLGPRFCCSLICSCNLLQLLQGIEFWAVNTDAQALAHHRCENRMQIGSESTRGLGCGGNPEIGRIAAMESQEGLQKVRKYTLKHSACMPCIHS